MFALTLLLSAAAGVNAILGGKVGAVKISEDSFICADDCVYEGVYFAQLGYWCPEKEIIRVVDPEGNTSEWFPFDCTGADQQTGSTERPLDKEDEPRKCEIQKSASEEPDMCTSTKSIGGGVKLKIVQWSEIENELKSAGKECDKNKPAP